jgi:large subunit ribosomal protein LP2
MKHIAAYALLVLGGKSEPSADELTAFLKDAGVKAEQEKVDALVEALKGKQFHELVEAGLAKISSMGASAAVAGGKAEVKAEVVEEKVVEEVDVDMGGLFGGEEDEY